jgi:hypothetical protein
MHPHNSPVLARPVSSLRLTWYVTTFIACLFPVLDVLITRQGTLAGMLSGIVINVAVISLIVGIVYVVRRAGEKGVQRLGLARPVYAAELVLVLVATYWVRKGLYYALIVLTNPPDPGWQGSWLFRYFIGLSLMASAFIYLFHLALHFQGAAQQKRIESEKMQTEFAQVRLQALHSQVNPHFLFNSLSVLSSLVHLDAELSEKFIVQLSVAYRYILEQKDDESVVLASELAFLEAYFFLLQIRFDNKIRLRREISPQQLNARLPPLTLQLLVENAVKHNKMSQAEPLTIRLYDSGEKLVIENNVNRRAQPEKSTGIGLENIRKRYAFFTGQPVEVSATEGYFTVTIPLLHEAPAARFTFK